MLDISAEFATKLNELHTKYIFTVEYGQKYDKIVQNYKDSVHTSGGSVHAFIERTTGKLIKAATWNSPQRDKDGLAYRYDISTPEKLQQAINISDPYGSYLYKR
jgi:hypothetical protein